LNGVGELSGGRDGSLGFLTVGLLLFILITLLEFLLEFHNFLLEDELIRLMLRLKSQDLVVSLFRVTLSEHNLTVHLFAVLSNVLDLAVVAFVDPFLFLLLLTHDINLTTELFVLSLEVRVLDKSFIELVLIGFDVVHIVLHLGRGRADLL